MLGPEKRVTVNTRDSLCHTLSLVSELDLAERLALENLEIAERVFPEEQPRAMALLTLATVYRRSGRVSEAIARLEECTRFDEVLQERSGGPPAMGPRLMLASIYQIQERHQEALDLVAPALPMASDLEAPPNVSIAVLEVSTVALEGLGRREEARPYRALWQAKNQELIEQSKQATWLIWAARSFLAEAGDALDDPERARELAHEACELASADGRNIHGYAQWILSEAEERCGDRPAALRAARIALEAIPETADADLREMFEARVRSLEQ